MLVRVDKHDTNEEKSYVVVDGNNRVRFRQVKIADSDGKEVKLSEGVQPGERLALTPGTGLREGELVQPVAQPQGGQSKRSEGGSRPL